MIGERTGASSQSPWLLASRGGIDGHPCTTNAPNRVKGGSGMKIAFFGSSLLSAYWNGAATYYRGMLRALAALCPEISFFISVEHTSELQSLLLFSFSFFFLFFIFFFFF